MEQERLITSVSFEFLLFTVGIITTKYVSCTPLKLEHRDVDEATLWSSSQHSIMINMFLHIDDECNSKKQACPLYYFAKVMQ